MRSFTLTFLTAVPAALAQDACSPLHLVYARATTEPPASYSPGQFDTAAARTWSKGYGAAGYSLYSNVSALIPGATGYPVHYPASMGGGSPQEGVQDMTNHLVARAKACPNQKYAMGGHSQGGFVTTGTIGKLPRDVLARVIAVTMFGAPGCPASVRDRCISYCQSGDTICIGKGGGGGGMPKGKGGMGKAPGGMGGKMPGGMGKGGLPGKGGVGPKGKGDDAVAPPAEPAAPTPPPAEPDAGAPEPPAEPAAGADDAPADPALVRRQGKLGKGPKAGGGGSGPPGNCPELLSRPTSGLGTGGHLGYNADGLYVRAAACYIQSKFRG